MRYFPYNKSLGSGELRMRLLVDRALAALNSWLDSADRVVGSPFLPKRTPVKYRCWGVIWHDRILNYRKVYYDQV